MFDWIVEVILFILFIGIAFDLVNVHYKIRSLEENQNDFNPKDKSTPETKKTMWG